MLESGSIVTRVKIAYCQSPQGVSPMGTAKCLSWRPRDVIGKAHISCTATAFHLYLHPKLIASFFMASETTLSAVIRYFLLDMANLSLYVKAYILL